MQNRRHVNAFILAVLFIGPVVAAVLPSVAHVGEAMTGEDRKLIHETSITSLLYHSLLSQRSTRTESIGSFPVHQQFWRGPSLLFLGSGIRYHTLGWLNIQVYEAGLYVDEATAAAELRRLELAGFFTGGDYGTDRMCEALAACICTRVLELRILRSITGKQFSDALGKSLEPRIARTGAEKLLPAFVEFFKERALGSGASVPIMWTPGPNRTALQLDLFPPGSLDFTDVKPECTVPSQSFAGALFDIYFCRDSPLVGARDKWAAAARALMQHPTSSE